MTNTDSSAPIDPTTDGTAGEKLGEGHYIEALHAAWMVQEMIQKFLIDHPVVSGSEYLSSMADRAFDGVYDLYQAIAADGSSPSPATPETPHE